MMRIHFTAEDMNRVALATTSDPLWEVLLSLHLLQERDIPPAFAHWRRLVRANSPIAVQLLFELAPPLGYSPDFITPGRGDLGVDDQLELVRSTPRRRLRDDIAQLTGNRRGTPWTSSLASGEPAAMRRLGLVLADYHQVAIAPFQREMQAHIKADLDNRRQAQASGGVNGLLSSLHPRSIWRSPVLEVPIYAERDLHLQGRGLILVPSFFCRIQPITLLTDALPPVLVYPASPPVGWIRQSPTEPRAARDPVRALLGGTRAAVLRAATSGANTTDLSAMLNVSPAAVSRHTAVLRDAGLVRSVRDGGSVIHLVTPLGRALLNSEPTD